MLDYLQKSSKIQINKYRKMMGGKDSRIYKGMDSAFYYFCYTNHPIV